MHLPITAEEMIETARDAYFVPQETVVVACREDEAEERAESEEGNVIVVCRRRAGPVNPFLTRDGPLPRMDQTATGAPRAPDVSGLPPCMGVCMRVGRVPPPALMVDVTKFPEPLSARDAALVSRAPPAPGEAKEPMPLAGERVPIPLD